MEYVDLNSQLFKRKIAQGLGRRRPRFLGIERREGDQKREGPYITPSLEAHSKALGGSEKEHPLLWAFTPYPATHLPQLLSQKEKRRRAACLILRRRRREPGGEAARTRTQAGSPPSATPPPPYRVHAEGLCQHLICCWPPPFSLQSKLAFLHFTRTPRRTLAASP